MNALRWSGLDSRTKDFVFPIRRHATNRLATQPGLKSIVGTFRRRIIHGHEISGFEFRHKGDAIVPEVCLVHSDNGSRLC